jgi:hypothetical protein
VERRRQITEEDILMTEAMIARSYGRVKRSVMQAPSRAFRLMTRQGADAGSRERGSRPDMTREILSMIIPLAAPYVTGYLKDYMAKVFSGERD